jgi:hypothetical protein
MGLWGPCTSKVCDGDVTSVYELAEFIHKLGRRSVIEPRDNWIRGPYAVRTGDGSDDTVMFVLEYRAGVPRLLCRAGKAGAEKFLDDAMMIEAAM